MDTSETKQVAMILERIVWNALLQCEGLPESTLHWPPPLPYSSSLFTLVVHLLEGIEWWILRPLEVQLTYNDDKLDCSSLKTFADIKIYHGQCMRALHTACTTLSTSDMIVDVTLPMPKGEGLLVSTLKVTHLIAQAPPSCSTMAPSEPVHAVLRVRYFVLHSHPCRQCSRTKDRYACEH